MRARPLAVAAIVLVGARAEAAEPPTLVFARGTVTLARLPPVLDDEAVATHLRTGLTTVFLFKVECRGAASQKGVAQVALRYDLWDEVYHVQTVPAPPGETAAKPTASAQEWWRGAVLTVAPVEGRWLAAPARAKVTLQVLPFSQAEQRDAQDWLLRSFQAPPDNRPPTAAGARAVREAAPIRNLYGSMLAASIGQRSLITYSWTVAVTMESR